MANKTAPPTKPPTRPPMREADPLLSPSAVMLVGLAAALELDGSMPNTDRSTHLGVGQTPHCVIVPSVHTWDKIQGGLQMAVQADGLHPPKHGHCFR